MHPSGWLRSHQLVDRLEDASPHGAALHVAGREHVICALRGPDRRVRPVLVAPA